MKRTVVPGVAGAAGLVGASLIALLPVGTAGASEAAPVARAAGKLDWVSCEQLGMGGRATECGYLTVPMDWSNPSGKKIQLAVSRTKSRVPAAKYQGVMLVNPGGPGGSGLAYSGLKDMLPNSSGEAYDWIGFDPRGVGDSQPALSCISNYAEGKRPPYVPAKAGKATTASEKAWLKRSKRYAQACGKKHGDLLNHMRTVDTVRDMDALREALGADRINYLGFSYGTYLGQVYATMYPDRVRRMIFDGNVNPKGIWYSSQLNQDRAFEKVADRFFAWVARNNSTYRLGSSGDAVRTTYLNVIKELRDVRHDGVGANEFTDAFVRAMYAESLWADAAHALASWVRQRDIAPAKAAFRASLDPDDNLFAVYNAVQCTDTPWPTKYATWRKDAFQVAKQAPILTWSNVWFNTPCLYWPAKPGQAVKVDGSKAPPILLLNATLDGATPYAGALEVRRLFPKAVLIAEKDATTHSGAVLGGNPCIDKRIADYLLTGKLPARSAADTADVVCPRGAGPEPGLLPFDATSSLPAPDPQPRDQSLFDKIIGLLPSRAS
ncbi:alpha/beta hydrolase [Sporichthya polymorpha]|uniref:alpha/beta hydrolase n=1 Tax=Sporichthya polymorpha TaxID=35751 RepID=UPI00035D04E8|nr:alpha/beta hydrolase [Sporichthya polymorpha]